MQILTNLNATDCCQNTTNEKLIYFPTNSCKVQKHLGILKILSLNYALLGKIHALLQDVLLILNYWGFCLCWGLTSQSTIFQSCRDGATASWVINQYFRGVKCLAQGHNTAALGIEPPTSRSGVLRLSALTLLALNVKRGWQVTVPDIFACYFIRESFNENYANFLDLGLHALSCLLGGSDACFKRFTLGVLMHGLSGLLWGFWCMV